jgi:1,4-dihydroxy-2-naphthoate octaprenyltransferase
MTIWITAARPHTLTASIAPVIVGSQLVYWWDQTRETLSPDAHLSVAFAAFACFIQLGTNLHNDYADFIKGADTDKRGSFLFFPLSSSHILWIFHTQLFA